MLEFLQGAVPPVLRAKRGWNTVQVGVQLRAAHRTCFVSVPWNLEISVLEIRFSFCPVKRHGTGFFVFPGGVYVAGRFMIARNWSG
ncbi:hypothetical protein G7K71_04145 [Desulfofundulus sp. TPOSR]|uniref:hypothetical protein n=1 Tax=Desulfofundulus sp. TPOSR TaxID=2714340 RepID=UPI001407C878|nr:hypothetical protein [Desulfofundulus sp. TPOSR]NHM26204.1 hypothetical protein [Desulfofundulus sp. TPOSR]